jgi:NADPH:quinone reductase-like Zn-dependent oxidoreductase
MKAAVLTAHGQSPAYADHPDPAPGDGDVLVRMAAAPVVPLDLLCASGTSYFGPPALPYVPGVQGVGSLDGERVWISSSAGMKPGDGTLAELCRVREVDVVRLPSGLPDELTDAAVAAIGLSGVAAWGALVFRGRLTADERVLVLGGGGAVGQAAIGIARSRGAARVVAVCRSEGAADRARRSGAHDVVVLPASGDAGELVPAITDALEGNAGIVLDPVFGWLAEAATQALRPGGRLVNLGGSASDAATFSSAVVRGKYLDVLGYTNNALTPDQRAEALTSVVRLAADGVVTVAHQVRPLAQVADAWADQASGAAAVRQVLTP